MNTSRRLLNSIIISTLLTAAYFSCLPKASGAAIHNETAKKISFEVISIRKSQFEFPSGQTFTDNGFSVRGVPLFFLISLAYDFRDLDRLRGLPAWGRSEKYDIQAKVADSEVPEWRQLSVTEKAVALQTLLTDRFKAKMHREYKEGNVYELTIAKSGLKARKPFQRETSPAVPTGMRMTVARYLTMDQLASVLPNLGIDRPVLNKTGLNGIYDCNLRTPNDDPAFLRPSVHAIVSDLRDQLGLDLRPTRGAIAILVIDKIERPTAN